MKISTKLLLPILLVVAGLVSAQVFVSNNVARAEAIKIASHLRVGMREEDAGKFLALHGLTNAIGVGAKTGWGRFYGLPDGSSLVLDYTAREIGTNGRWGGNGLLQRAFIQSNGVNVASIGFTNAP